MWKSSHACRCTPPIPLHHPESVVGPSNGVTGGGKLRQTPDHTLHKGAVLIPAVELIGLEGAEVSSTRKRLHNLPPRVLRDGNLIGGLKLVQEPPDVLKAYETE